MNRYLNILYLLLHHLRPLGDHHHPRPGDDDHRRIPAHRLVRLDAVVLLEDSDVDHLHHIGEKEAMGPEEAGGVGSIVEEEVEGVMEMGLMEGEADMETTVDEVGTVEVEGVALGMMEEEVDMVDEGDTVEEEEEIAGTEEEADTDHQEAPIEVGHQHQEEGDTTPDQDQDHQSEEGVVRNTVVKGDIPPPGQGQSRAEVEVGVEAQHRGGRRVSVGVSREVGVGVEVRLGERGVIREVSAGAGLGLGRLCLKSRCRCRLVETKSRSLRHDMDR